VKHLLNVLYVVSEGSYLSVQGETICVHVGGEEKVRVPVHTIESVVCLGHTTVSTPLLGFLGEKGISLSLLSTTGHFYARMEGPVHGSVLLRTAQYAAAANQAHRRQLAYAFVLSKIANARSTLLRSAREAGACEAGSKLRAGAEGLASIAAGLSPEADVDHLRGCEGAAAYQYFACFDEMIVANKQSFYFRGRSRRPPMDNVNALLSFLYTLLVHDTKSALESVGLDPAVGFLHAMRPGRPALSLDVAEELRSPLCDRLALGLINLKQLKPSDFEQSATAVLLSDAARRTVIGAWQRRKREEIMHPFLGEKVPIGLIPFAQARLLARYLRGEMDCYPPFRWR
jgi:CRISP-associated protein Cas1